MTDDHTKYLAYELTRRCPSDSVEKLTSVLADAQLDEISQQMTQTTE